MNCPSCQEPMLGTAALCGRCQPPKEGRKQIEQQLESAQDGKNGKREAPFEAGFDNEAPASRCFAYWDVSEDVAVLMASEISGHRLSYKEGRPAHFWPNAEDRHPSYRGRVVGGIL